MKNTQILIASEAARILGLTPATVRYLENHGKLKALKTASGVRIFDRSQVELLARARAAQKARA